MPDLTSIVAGSANGTELSLQELLRTLKLQGRLSSLITEALVEKTITASARKEGIQVSDEELQKAADAFRVRHGLNKAADTRRWLALNRLSQADLEESLERALLRQKLADKVTAGRIEKAFADNRARFDRARLRHLIVPEEGVAHELLNRIQEDGADFADLARQHSSDTRTKAAGGRLGIVPRRRLPADIEAAVFAARKGDIVGPFKTKAGYILVKVEDLLLGQLDAATSAAIRQQLFRNWIAQQLQAEQVEVKLDV